MCSFVNMLNIQAIEVAGCCTKDFNTNKVRIEKLTPPGM
jgi:hypothetical protein